MAKSRRALLKTVVTAPDLRPVEGKEADQELVALAKAVGHPLRVQILRLLAREITLLCGQIVYELPKAQATVSQHLKVLVEAGLLRVSTEGTTSSYEISPSELKRLKVLVAGL